MLCIDELLTLEPFQQLPQEKLEWACDRAKELQIPTGTQLIAEGGDPNGFFILLKGKVSITRLSEGVEMPIGQHEAPAFFGEIPVLMDGPVLVSMRTVTDCHLHQITCPDFLTLLHECRGFERSIFREVANRLRRLESFIRNREKMAALGTLAAGLAHELNNPAAALVRALRDVVPAIRELERMNLIYGLENPDPDHTEEWQAVRDRGYEAILNPTMDALALSDRENELLDWLEDYGVEEAWKLSEPLAMGGIEVDTLERLTQCWRDRSDELRDQGIRWLALSFDVMSMIKNGLRGAERISDLVHSMKSYSHLDRGVQQCVDIHRGLDDTLQLLSYKLKAGVTVQRKYDQTLPEILAYGSELNQVWTNLIDNAIDAMGGKGTLDIRTCQDGNFARIEIIDSGTGIAPEIQSRIFEPFFTTKDMGKGSGLGLETVSRIVENRHHGIITVDSQPGSTCFTVCLPLPEASAQ
ncbi:ATP-binding protein [Oscillatoria sp. CS-180]|uniref:ATP-binding protein n=1 Tax=Oscillatoria sp. CS-180 TaxID=3021720 RepID=UPI00232AF8B8|nr:ATP-binding protein [Oscillatoria sp. CS-180]MDB9529538.1 ATP-binding protein [Oscillatoria sp. CS-180]